MNGNGRDWRVTRPAGCTCRDGWQVCEACKDVPRRPGNGVLRPVAMTASAQRLVLTVEQNVIPEEVRTFKERLWARWEGGELTGEQAEAALRDLSGGPDPDVKRGVSGFMGYLTRRV